MSKINLEELDSMQFDVLKEIGNIGAGNATTALAKMINCRVDMKEPKVRLLNFSDIASSIGGEEDAMVGILLELSEDIDGMMLFLLDLVSAKNLVNTLLVNMGLEPIGDEIEFGDMHLSALRELGNIITGAYLAALSDLTRLSIVSSVPHLQIDMAGAILSLPAILFGKIADQVLFIETTFTEDADIKGYYILVPELESYDIILKSLGITL